MQEGWFCFEICLDFLLDSVDYFGFSGLFVFTYFYWNTFNYFIYPTYSELILFLSDAISEILGRVLDISTTFFPLTSSFYFISSTFFGFITFTLFD